MDTNYLNLSVDSFDRNGIPDTEIQALVSAGLWKEVDVKEDADVDVTVQFRKPDGKFYSETGKLEPGTKLVVNEQLGIGIVKLCRNNIESDWRTLQKLYC